jgi:hypothetical protein
VSNRSGRELVLLFFLLFYVLMNFPQPPTGSTRIPPAAAVYPPSLANARRRIFILRWVMFWRVYTCRIGDALAHLHVCSTRRADYFAFPSLASARSDKNCSFIRPPSRQKQFRLHHYYTSYWESFLWLFDGLQLALHSGIENKFRLLTFLSWVSLVGEMAVQPLAFSSIPSVCANFFIGAEITGG